MGDCLTKMKGYENTFDDDEEEIDPETSREDEIVELRRSKNKFKKEHAQMKNELDAMKEKLAKYQELDKVK